MQLREWYLPREAVLTVKWHSAGACHRGLTLRRGTLPTALRSFPWTKTLWNDLVSPSLAMNTSNLTSPPNGEFDLVSAHLAQPTHSGSPMLPSQWILQLRMKDAGISPRGAIAIGDSQKHFSAHETCIVSSLPPLRASGLLQSCHHLFQPSVCAQYAV